MSEQLPVYRVEVSRRTKCNYEIYQRVLGFSESFSGIKGKILDIAAGDSDTAYYINEVLKPEGTRVHRVDADYTNKKPPYEDDAKAGNALALPYAENEFDEAWMVNFLVYAGIHPRDRAQAIKEALRVIKEDKFVRIFPIYPKPGIMRTDQQEKELYGGRIRIVKPYDTVFNQHILIIQNQPHTDQDLLIQLLGRDIHFDPKSVNQVSPY